MSELSDYQKEIGTWAVKTFPLATNKSRLKHLEKEVQELIDGGDPSEAADCFILLLNYAHVNNFDLLDEARRKMVVNYSRKWGLPEKDGVVEHVED